MKGKYSSIFVVVTMVLSFLMGCSDPECETFETYPDDVMITFNINHAGTGAPIGAFLNDKSVKLLAGISGNQLLKKEWQNVSNDQSKFSVDLTPSCGLPTSQNYSLLVGEIDTLLGTIFFDRNFELEECKQVCTGKFISRIDFLGFKSEDYKYQDRVRQLDIAL